MARKKKSLDEIGVKYDENRVENVDGHEVRSRRGHRTEARAIAMFRAGYSVEEVMEATKCSLETAEKWQVLANTPLMPSELELADEAVADAIRAAFMKGTDEAKRGAILALIAVGFSRKRASSLVRVKYQTFQKWMKEERGFADAVEAVTDTKRALVLKVMERRAFDDSRKDSAKHLEMYAKVLGMFDGGKRETKADMDIATDFSKVLQEVNKTGKAEVPVLKAKKA